MPDNISISALTFDLAESYLAGAMPIVARMSATVYRNERSIDVVIPLNNAEMTAVYKQLQQVALDVLVAEQPSD